VRSRSNGGANKAWGGTGAGPAREPQGKKKDTVLASGSRRQNFLFCSPPEQETASTHKIAKAETTTTNSIRLKF